MLLLLQKLTFLTSGIRFCFLSSYGKFDYELSYDASMGVQNIDLYYDTEEQWYRAYGPRSDLTTCRERESVLQVRHPN